MRRFVGATALLAALFGLRPVWSSSPLDTLVPADPILYLRVDPAGGSPELVEGVESWLLTTWLGWSDVDGLGRGAPWHFFISEEAERAVWSVVAPIDDTGAFESSLLGSPEKPGYEIADGYVLIARLPLPATRGPMPATSSRSPVFARAMPNRLVSRFGDQLEGLGEQNRAAMRRWEAYLSGGDVAPQAPDGPQQSDLLERVALDTELVELELDFSNGAMEYRTRWTFADGTELAALAAAQAPAKPTRVGHLDPALPAHVWTNFNVEGEGELATMLRESFARALHADTKLVALSGGGERVVGSAVGLGATELESVEWPAIPTSDYRASLAAYYSDAGREPSGPIRARFEPDVSALDSVVVDRLTTYALEPAASQPIAQVEQFLGWDDKTVFSAVSVGTERNRGFKRLQQLVSRGTSGQSLALPQGAPEAMIVYARTDIAAWDLWIRSRLPEAIPALAMTPERPASVLYATADSSGAELGGRVDFVQFGLQQQLAEAIDSLANRLYEQGRNHALGRGVEADPTAAAKWYGKAVQVGHVDARIELADLLWSGSGVEPDRDEAIRHYLAAASQGSLRGQVAFGNIYYYGYGRDRDYDVALRWYRLAAVSNDATAQTRLGEAYANGYGVEENHEVALEWYRSAVEQDMVEAQIGLAKLYARPGPHQDWDTAEHWYRRAAEHNHPEAFLQLGHMYRRASDYARATVEFQKCAELGNAACNYTLGRFYQMGTGVERDYERALEYFQAASDGDGRSNHAARTRIAGLYFSRLVEGEPPDGLLEDLRDAAEFGILDARFRMGQVYASGVWGVATDDAEAVKWFRLAAESGQTRAMSVLGTALIRGIGGEPDVEEALEWFRKGADAGDGRAMFQLGDVYEFGKGVERDWSEAIQWYLQAAEEGHEGAQQRLGVMYMSGNGVDTDLLQSYKWMLLASRGPEPVRKMTEGLLPYLRERMTEEQIAEAEALANAFVPRWRR